MPDRLAYAALDLRQLWINSSHRRTDPACMLHSSPVSYVAIWWHRFNRGRVCRECKDIRARSRPCKRHEYCVLVEHGPLTPCFVFRPNNNR